LTEVQTVRSWGTGGTDDHHAEADEAPVSHEQNPIWQQDNVMLRSVGIDIGSAGTQVVFSRLHFRRLGEDLTSRYVVARRDTIYRSLVWLTPYADDHQIDSGRISALVGQAYRDARQHPDDIDTGAVILTGEALRRDNARRLADTLSARCGELVCVSAGHNIEAMLAAYGSGAARASHDRQERILNIDIGGGTTKLALVDSGRVVATAALRVGGRLHVIDADGRLVRLDPAGRDHAARAGLAWSLGDTVEPTALDRVAGEMADMVIAAVGAHPLPHQVRRLFLTEPIDDLGRVDAITFSGGVAEYIYGRETRDFGDLGRRLGTAIRARLAAGALPAAVAPAGERIRATVLGASEYSVQLSGNTSYISRAAALLPRRNLQVLRPGYTPGTPVDPDALADAIRRHLVAFDADETNEVVLALGWEGVPSHERITGLARGIVSGLADRITAQLPMYIVLDGDVALTLGSILRNELGVTNDLLVIDGVSLWDFDYIDLGTLREPSHTVPLTIKSLVFNDDPRQRKRASDTPSLGASPGPAIPPAPSWRSGPAGSDADRR
jgi:ethanolamine utilization protein EutA